MSMFRNVLFDVDGVLLDSLPSHLKICEDKNREYGLNLKIPDASAFKNIVRSGTRISPMEYFFRAVGFPDEFAERADVQYQKVFRQRYALPLFPGVHRTLRALHDCGAQLGIVTSNVKPNVVGPLNGSMDFFRSDCVYTKDNMGGLSKREAILSAVQTLGARPAETLYVGDQPADWEAAKAAGVGFLGVAYGWGLSSEGNDFPTVDKVADIYRYVLGRRIEAFEPITSE